MEESLLPVVSVITMVAVSRRMSRFRLQLGDRLEALIKGGMRGGVTDPHLCVGVEPGRGLRFRSGRQDNVQ